MTHSAGSVFAHTNDEPRWKAVASGFGASIFFGVGISMLVGYVLRLITTWAFTRRRKLKSEVQSQLTSQTDSSSSSSRKGEGELLTYSDMGKVRFISTCSAFLLGGIVFSVIWFGGYTEPFVFDASDNVTSGSSGAQDHFIYNYKRAQLSETGTFALQLVLKDEPSSEVYFPDIRVSDETEAFVTPTQLLFKTNSTTSGISISVVGLRDRDSSEDDTKVGVWIEFAPCVSLDPVYNGLAPEPFFVSITDVDGNAWSFRYLPVGVIVLIVTLGIPIFLIFSRYVAAQTLECSFSPLVSCALWVVISGVFVAVLLSVRITDVEDDLFVVVDPNDYQIDRATILEGGATAFTFALAHKPTGTVSFVGIATTEPDQASVSPADVLFTPSNWDQMRAVTVSATRDLARDARRREKLQVVFPLAVSTDDKYANTKPKPIDFRVLDAENQPRMRAAVLIPGLVGIFTGLWFGFAPGQMLQSGTNDLAYTNSPEICVTVISAVVTCAIGIGLAAGSRQADQNAQTELFRLEVPDALAGENYQAAYVSLALATAPRADVVFSKISSSRPSEAVLLTTEIVFTTSDWYVAQTVTAIGVPDHVRDGDQSVFIILEPAESTDSLFSGAKPPAVQIVVTDIDTAFVWPIGFAVALMIVFGMFVGILAFMFVLFCPLIPWEDSSISVALWAGCFCWIVGIVCAYFFFSSLPTAADYLDDPPDDLPANVDTSLWYDGGNCALAYGSDFVTCSLDEACTYCVSTGQCVSIRPDACAVQPTPLFVDPCALAYFNESSACNNDMSCEYCASLDTCAHVDSAVDCPPIERAVCAATHGYDGVSCDSDADCRYCAYSGGCVAASDPCSVPVFDPVAEQGAACSAAYNDDADACRADPACDYCVFSAECLHSSLTGCGSVDVDAICATAYNGDPSACSADPACEYCGDAEACLSASVAECPVEYSVSWANYVAVKDVTLPTEEELAYCSCSALGVPSNSHTCACNCFVGALGENCEYPPETLTIRTPGPESEDYADVPEVYHRQPLETDQALASVNDDPAIPLLPYAGQARFYRLLVGFTNTEVNIEIEPRDRVQLLVSYEAFVGLEQKVAFAETEPANRLSTAVTVVAEPVVGYPAGSSDGAVIFDSVVDDDLTLTGADLHAGFLNLAIVPIGPLDVLLPIRSDDKSTLEMRTAQSFDLSVTINDKAAAGVYFALIVLLVLGLILLCTVRTIYPAKFKSALWVNTPRDVETSSLASAAQAARSAFYELASATVSVSGMSRFYKAAVSVQASLQSSSCGGGELESEEDIDPALRAPFAADLSGTAAEARALADREAPSDGWYTAAVHWAGDTLVGLSADLTSLHRFEVLVKSARVAPTVLRDSIAESLDESGRVVGLNTAAVHDYDAVDLEPLKHKWSSRAASLRGAKSMVAGFGRSGLAGAADVADDGGDGQGGGSEITLDSLPALAGESDRSSDSSRDTGSSDHSNQSGSGSYAGREGGSGGSASSRTAGTSVASASVSGSEDSAGSASTASSSGSDDSEQQEEYSEQSSTHSNSGSTATGGGSYGGRGPSSSDELGSHGHSSHRSANADGQYSESSDDDGIVPGAVVPLDRADYVDYQMSDGARLQRSAHETKAADTPCYSKLGSGACGGANDDSNDFEVDRPSERYGCVALPPASKVGGREFTHYKLADLLGTVIGLLKVEDENSADGVDEMVRIDHDTIGRQPENVHKISLLMSGLYEFVNAQTVAVAWCTRKLGTTAADTEALNAAGMRGDSARKPRDPNDGLAVITARAVGLCDQLNDTTKVVEALLDHAPLMEAEIGEAIILDFLIVDSINAFAASYVAALTRFLSRDGCATNGPLAVAVYARVNSTATRFIETTFSLAIRAGCADVVIDKASAWIDDVNEDTILRELELACGTSSSGGSSDGDEDVNRVVVGEEQLARVLDATALLTEATHLVRGVVVGVNHVRGTRVSKVSARMSLALADSIQRAIDFIEPHVERIHDLCEATTTLWDRVEASTPPLLAGPVHLIGVDKGLPALSPYEAVYERWNTLNQAKKAAVKEAKKAAKKAAKEAAAADKAAAEAESAADVDDEAASNGSTLEVNDSGSGSTHPSKAKANKSTGSDAKGEVSSAATGPESRSSSGDEGESVSELVEGLKTVANIILRGAARETVSATATAVKSIPSSGELTDALAVFAEDHTAVAAAAADEIGWSEVSLLPALEGLAGALNRAPRQVMVTLPQRAQLLSTEEALAVVCTTKLNVAGLPMAVIPVRPLGWDTPVLPVVSFLPNTQAPYWVHKLLLLLFVLAESVAGTVFSVIKIYFNVALLYRAWTALAWHRVFDVPKVSWPSIMLSVRVSLDWLPGIKGIMRALAVLGEIVKVFDWFSFSFEDNYNCGGVVLLVAPFFLFAGSAVAFLMLKYDVLLKVGIALRGYGIGTPYAYPFDKVGGVLTSVCLYVLQILILNIVGLFFADVLSVNRSCSDFDHGAVTVSVVIMVIFVIILLLYDLLVFSGIDVELWSRDPYYRQHTLEVDGGWDDKGDAYSCGSFFYLRAAFVGGTLYRLLICGPLGIWTMAMVRCHRVKERAKKYDTHVHDTDTQEEAVMSLLGKANSLVWFAVPGGAFLAKLQEAMNESIIFGQGWTFDGRNSAQFRNLQESRERGQAREWVVKTDELKHMTSSSTSDGEGGSGCCASNKREQLEKDIAEAEARVNHENWTDWFTTPSEFEWQVESECETGYFDVQAAYYSGFLFNGTEYMTTLNWRRLAELAQEDKGGISPDFELFHVVVNTKEGRDCYGDDADMYKSLSPDHTVMVTVTLVTSDEQPVARKLVSVTREKHQRIRFTLADLPFLRGLADLHEQALRFDVAILPADYAGELFKLFKPNKLSEFTTVDDRIMHYAARKVYFVEDEGSHPYEVTMATGLGKRIRDWVMNVLTITGVMGLAVTAGTDFVSLLFITLCAKFAENVVHEWMEQSPLIDEHFGEAAAGHKHTWREWFMCSADTNQVHPTSLVSESSIDDVESSVSSGVRDTATAVKQTAASGAKAVKAQRDNAKFMKRGSKTKKKGKTAHAAVAYAWNASKSSTSHTSASNSSS